MGRGLPSSSVLGPGLADRVWIHRAMRAGTGGARSERARPPCTETVCVRARGSHGTHSQRIARVRRSRVRVSSVERGAVCARATGDGRGVCWSLVSALSAQDPGVRGGERADASQQRSTRGVPGRMAPACVQMRSSYALVGAASGRVAPRRGLRDARAVRETRPDAGQRLRGLGEGREDVGDASALRRRRAEDEDIFARRFNAPSTHPCTRRSGVRLLGRACGFGGDAGRKGGVVSEKEADASGTRGSQPRSSPHACPTCSERVGEAARGRWGWSAGTGRRAEACGRGGRDACHARHAEGHVREKM